MRTILTNGPGSLYSSLGDLPLITPMEESNDDSNSDSEASDISSSVSLTPSARLIMADDAAIVREHPDRRGEV